MVFLLNFRFQFMFSCVLVFLSFQWMKTYTKIRTHTHYKQKIELYFSLILIPYSLFIYLILTMNQYYGCHMICSHLLPILYCVLTSFILRQCIKSVHSSLLLLIWFTLSNSITSISFVAQCSLLYSVNIIINIYSFRYLFILSTANCRMIVKIKVNQVNFFFHITL